MIYTPVWSFQRVVEDLCWLFPLEPEVRPASWHAMAVDTDKMPSLIAHELRNFCMVQEIPRTLAELKAMVKPNLPWAEKHFRERVSGEPLNPPPSEAEWPFAMQGNAIHKDNEQFSHTYPERFWPKFANVGGKTVEGRQVFVPHAGIRYLWGDLGDVVALLLNEPTTRQAYLPVWFPEDTGAVQGQRLPCTLGYQFLIRDGKLHCSYYMRSCDFARHFRDDVYMAMRLVQWICGAYNDNVGADAKPDYLKPGELFMTIASFHCFKGDFTKLREGRV